MSAEGPGVPGAVLVARAAGRRFAFDAGAVLCVRGFPQATRLPHAPAHLLGVFHHEGRIVPLLDLVRFVGAREPPARPRVVIVEHGRKALGLVVEAVEDVLPVPGAGLEGTSAGLHSVAQGFVMGVLRAPAEPAPADDEQATGPDAGPDRDAMRELLRHAPAWLRRIHLPDGRSRRHRDHTRVRLMLAGDDVHLIDVDLLWRAAGARSAEAVGGLVA